MCKGWLWLANILLIVLIPRGIYASSCASYTLPLRLAKLAGTDNPAQYERWKKSSDPIWQDLYDEILEGTEKGYKEIDIENNRFELHATIKVRNDRLIVKIIRLVLVKRSDGYFKPLELRDRSRRGTLTLPYLIGVFESAIRQSIKSNPEINQVQVVANAVINHNLKSELKSLGFEMQSGRIPIQTKAMIAGFLFWQTTVFSIRSLYNADPNWSYSDLQLPVALILMTTLPSYFLAKFIATFYRDYRLTIPVSRVAPTGTEIFPID